MRGAGGATAPPVPAITPARTVSPPPAPAPIHKTAVPAPAPAPVTQPGAPIPFAGDLSGLWHSLVDAVGRASPFTRGYLIDAHPVSFVKGVFVIGFDPEFEDHLGLVDNARNHTLLAAKLAELGHAQAMIKFIKAEAPTGWERKPAAVTASAPVATKAATATAKPGEAATAAPAEKKSAPVAFNKDEFKNDPLIQKALEIFKGTIVEVRA